MKRARSLGYNDNQFRNIVVCVTGLSSQRKNKLHNIVNSLGGRYTGDLIIENTTHLIAEVAEGAKHHEAARTEHIIIVKPSWLEECLKCKMKVNETPFLLHPPKAIQDTNESERLPDKDVETTIVLLETCHKILSSIPSSSLFESCSFYFLGFNEENLQVANNFIEKQNERVHYDAKKLGAKHLLAKLVRHGFGTRYWELTAEITHVIVNENCDKDDMFVALYIEDNHPNRPAIVSPHWIIQSLQSQALQSTSSFPARRIESKPKPKPVPKTPFPLPSKIKTASNPISKSNIFQGMIFSIIQSSPSETFFKSSISTLEQQIRSNGGLMLSNRILEALEKDVKKNRETHRILCVVFLGRLVKNYATRSALLTKVERFKFCPMVLVNPNYIQCCIHEKMEFLPNLYPILFQPQPYPLHGLPDAFLTSRKEDKIGQSKHGIVAAVSGFVGVERFGIVQILKQIGADYTENLTRSNTHLICKKAEGPKYERGLVWSLHVVSIKWLFHILKYGFEGDNEKKLKTISESKDIIGCEPQFYFDEKKVLRVKEPHRQHNILEARKKNVTTQPNSVRKDKNEKFDQKSTILEPISTDQKQLIKSSLLKLQHPLAKTNTESQSVSSSSNGTLNIGLAGRRKRKRRPLSLSLDKHKNIMKKSEINIHEDDNVRDGDKEILIQNDKRVEPDKEKDSFENEDDTFGSLVESQAIFYASRND